MGHPSVGHGFVHLCVCVGAIYECLFAHTFMQMFVCVYVCICHLYTSGCREENIWPPLVRDLTLRNGRLQTAERKRD